jgi:3-hydroxyisobutyrate dehydrogenase-like beta-hydroxyacid dehydrogenase
MSNELHTVSVLGLGPMGAAVTRALLAAQCRVTVWNRTTERAEPLRAAGAQLAAEPSEAVAASQLTIAVLASDRVTASLLQTPEVVERLKGRTLVDLSSGSSRGARELAGWAAEHGAEYLDGRIMGYSRRVGERDMAIIYAGPRATFERHASTLAILAPAQRHVSEDPGGASAAATALWAFHYGAYGAFLEAAALADDAGTSLEDFLALADPMVDELRDSMGDTVRRLQTGCLAGDDATIDAIQRDLEGAKRVFARHGMEPKILSGFVEYLVASQAAGDGGSDPAAAMRHMPKATEE